MVVGGQHGIRPKLDYRSGKVSSNIVRGFLTEVNCLAMFIKETTDKRDLSA